MSFPAAKNSGLLKTFQDGAQRKRVRVVLIVWAVVCSGMMAGCSPAAGSLAVLSAFLVFVHYFRLGKKQFGGTTGDLAGYFLQVCELVMLAVLVLAGGCLWK